MKNELSILSMGGGQDSACMGHMAIHDAEFRRKYAPGKLLVVMAATGDEHRATPEMAPHLSRMNSMMTDEYVRDYLAPMFASAGIEFVHLTAEMGFHGNNWHTLQERYDSNSSCGSKAFPKVCTDRLKIDPLYKFVADWVARNYGSQYGLSNKRGLVQFAADFGKINVLIGIAAKEEKRIGDLHAKKKVKNAATGQWEETNEYVAPLWRRQATNVLYPLVEMGLDRQGCQDKIRELGGIVPFPSNCRRCPFMNEIELLWLYTFDREAYTDWVRQEANKLAANAALGVRNLAVWGQKTIPQMLATAQAKYGHLTEEQLFLHKFSHGHCVGSKY